VTLPTATLSKPPAFALAAIIMLASLDARVGSQSMTMTVTGGQVRVQSPGFRFISGPTLARLKDGLTVRVEMEMRVLAGPGAATAAAHARQTFVLSYDLWEERFAASVSASQTRSVSHVTSAAAEAWCIEQLTMPVSALGALARQPFWIRLESRIIDGQSAAREDEGLTLRGIIDTLSRRQTSEKTSHSTEGGPFQVRP
jgi:hypothetical protein